MRHIVALLGDGVNRKRAQATGVTRARYTFVDLESGDHLAHSIYDQSIFILADSSL